MVVQLHARVTVTLAAGVGVLLVPAVLAELAVPGGPMPAQPTLVAVVALAFTASGLVLLGTTASAVLPPLVVGVGVAWLLPSLVPGTLLWHQGVLLLALTLPVRGPRWSAGLLATLAVGLALGVGGQVAAALVFGASAVWGLWPGTAPRGVPRLQALASGTVAVALGALVGWRGYGGYSAAAGLALYEVALMVVAVLLGAGARVIDARAGRMQARVLAHPPDDGVDGLMEILRDELGDPSLRLLPPGSAGANVAEDGHAVAVLSGREETLSDPAVAVAATEAVRIVRLWVERRDEVERLQASLVEARRRVSRAVQEEQRSMAAEMGTHVLSRIRAAVAGLDDVDLDAPEAAAAVREARAQLDAADDSIAGTVSGPTGPSPASLVGALTLLTAGSAVPSSFRSEPPSLRDLTGRLSEESARALYFVCSEALANAHKHAHASRVDVALTCPVGWATLTITDDGTGAADPGGSGLRGLADRLRAAGGTLEVGRAGAQGTAVVARVPLDQPVEPIRVQGRSPR